MPAPLTSPAPTALDAERAVKTLLHEWFAQWFDGTTKALGLETACAWPAIPGTRIIFDQAERPDGDAPWLHLVLTEIAQGGGVTGGMAGQTQGELRFPTYLVQCWVNSSETTAPGKADESVATLANQIRALAQNRESLGQLGEKRVRVVTVRNAGAVPTEGAGKTHLVSLTLKATYPVKYSES